MLELVNLLIGIETTINVKNFIVTGGSGFIGSHFIDLLLSKKLHVLNLDLKKILLKEKIKL